MALSISLKKEISLFFVRGLVFISLFLFSAAFLRAEEKKDILLLHSYNQNLGWADEITRACVQSFQGEKVDIIIEYMDSKRFSPEIIFPPLEALYRIKYSKHQPEVIIATDNNALRFLRFRKKELFPDVPLVFCGINNYQTDLIDGLEAVWGIKEEIDIQDNINLVLKLFPETKELLVINDLTPTGLENQKDFIQESSSFKGRLDFTFLIDINKESLIKKISSLKKGSVVLLFTFHLDNQGKRFTIEEFLDFICGNCPVPVFSFWEHYLGSGVLGGVMVNGRSQGKVAALLAKKILAGNYPDQAKGPQESPNIPLFDYRQLRKFSVKEKDLPSNSRILFRPFSFLEKYKLHLIFLFALFFVLIISIVVLSFMNFRRLLSEKKARQSQAQLRSYLINAPIGIIIINRKFNLLESNQAFCQLSGYSREDLVNKKIHILVESSDRKKAAFYFKQLLAKGDEQADLLCQRKDGTKRTWHIKAVCVHEDHILVFLMDIHDQKKYEENMLESLKEKETLIRELYHRTKNNMQVISSMLSLKSKYLKPHEDFHQVFKEISTKIQSMALIHQKLYQSKNLSNIHLVEYAKELAELIISSYNLDKEIVLSVQGGPIPVLIDTAIPCGLILNELISNSLKYAFTDRDKGKIEIKLKKLDKSLIEILVSDNGKAVPPDFDFHNTDTLGLSTVIALTENQLEGKVDFHVDHGLHCRLLIREDLYQKRI